MTQSALQRRLVRLAGAMNAKARRTGVRGRVTAAELAQIIVDAEHLCNYCGVEVPDMEGSFALRVDTPMREAVISVVKQEEEAIRSGRVGGQDPKHKRIRTPGGTYPVWCAPPPPGPQTPDARR